ncbi:translin [Viridothelium virens]|uniref:Translin n=1 Tax=Viridothelium virens TaxID=1048519 RepID=A0A6A6HNB7_VIRVR|nr:translin [Viridothelium virens]
MAEKMVNPSIFQHLQSKIDEETLVGEELRDIVNLLEKQEKSAQAALSRAHSTPTPEVSSVVVAAESAIRYEIDTIQKLSEAASKHPYYKYNGIWTRNIQDACFTILLCGWLGGYQEVFSSSSASGQLLTIEQVGQVMKVPVNLKDRDSFHLTIEEYLHALISLIDELARLARNSVTLGDYRRPLQISRFVKDLHAGFQILNLKNDILRRRSDGIKYRVKEIEDVVYDLSLRDLVPKETTE